MFFSMMRNEIRGPHTFCPSIVDARGGLTYSINSPTSSPISRRIFAFTDGSPSPYPCWAHVVYQQTVHAAPNRIPFCKGFPGPQFRGRGAHRKIRLRRRVAQDTRIQVSDDRRTLHHDARPVHGTVGRWLSEISGDARSEEISGAKIPAQRSSQVQRRITYRTGRAPLLQRSSGLHLPFQRLRPRKRPP